MREVFLPSTASTMYFSQLYLLITFSLPLIVATDLLFVLLDCVIKRCVAVQPEHIKPTKNIFSTI